mgnify:CR=1 FL=1
MKRIFCLFCTLLICFSLTCCKGLTTDVSIDLGSSERYTKEEIQDAVDCVIKKFSSFKGCNLKKVWYDEKASIGKTDTNTIVLLSDFEVDASGGDGSFNPNSTYEEWQWILTRDSKHDKWKVADWGYGNAQIYASHAFHLFF